VLISALTAQARADAPLSYPQGLGIGTYLGIGPGGFGFYALSVKKWLEPDQSVDGAVGAFFDEFYSHVDYKWNWNTRWRGISIPLYVGPGVSIFAGHRTWVGLRGTVGASRLVPGRKAWELFIELTPSFFIAPERIVEAALGFGARVYL